MRDYSRVCPQFWTGETGRQLKAIDIAEAAPAQLLALYLMTSPHANMIGLYYLSLPTIAHEVGPVLGTPEGARAAMSTLERIGFCFYDDAQEVVWIPEMARFQIEEKLKAGDNRIRGVINELLRYRGSKFAQPFHAFYKKRFNLPAVDWSEPQTPPSIAGFQAKVSQIPDKKGKREAPSKPLPRGSEAPSKPGAGTGAGSGAGTGSGIETTELDVLSNSPKKIKLVLENNTMSGEIFAGPGSSSPVLVTDGDWKEPDSFVALYNASTPDEHPKMQRITAARRQKIKKYVKLFPEHAFWEQVFVEVGRSEFLQKGSRDSPNFRGDLDWLLTKGRDQTENAVKVHEGKYRDGARNRGSPSPMVDRINEANRQTIELVRGSQA